MTELERVLFCEKHNRMNYEDKRNIERQNAYSTLQNMVNMLKEHSHENIDLQIPYNKRPSYKIKDRYGIPVDSEFKDIWVVLEMLCNGEYTLKKSDDAQSKS